MKYVIPMNGFIGWECATCKASVSGVDNGRGTIEPVSKYWNIERQEVYCGAECSLAKHEQINRT